MQTDVHLSYWEKEHWLTFDLAIVGAGITGFSVAAAYLEKFPKHKVAIFERGILPTGASTKNAGFACFGSPTEILSDIASMGEKDALALIQKRFDGLNMLFKRFPNEKSGKESFGGFELLKDDKALKSTEIDYLNQLLKPITNGTTYTVANHKIAEFGFNKQLVDQLLFNPFEAQIDSGLLLKSMYHQVVSMGAIIFTGTEIEAIESVGNGTRLLAKSLGKAIEFKANKTIVCTNAFATKLLKNVDVIPGRGQIISTEPIAGLPFKGTFHYDEGFYYFRNVGNRILLGGGRNRDFVGETTTELNITATIQKALEDLLFTVIYPNQKVTIEQRWAGIMAFGKEKSPIIQEVERNIICAIRGSGMGVALASQSANEVVTRFFD